MPIMNILWCYIFCSFIKNFTILLDNLIVSKMHTIFNFLSFIKQATLINVLIYF